MIERTVRLQQSNTLRVQLDGKPGSGFTLRILGGQSSNRPPVANAGADRRGEVGGVVQLDGSASTDPDGDALFYNWVLLSRPAASGATLSNPCAVKPTFLIDVPGTYIAQLDVSDGTARSQTDYVTITSLNVAPVADGGPDQTTTVGATATLNGSASHDADGNALTYTWAFTSRPQGSAAILQGATSVTPTFVVDAPGSYTARLIVNDGTVDSAPDTVVVTTTNSPPVADAGPDQTALVGADVTLDGSGSHDVDGDSLAYRWSLTAAPPGSAAHLNVDTDVRPTFRVDVPGTYVVQLIVNDGLGRQRGRHGDGQHAELDPRRGCRARSDGAAPVDGHARRQRLARRGRERLELSVDPACTTYRQRGNPAR